jgi:hypothetical protein
MLKVVENTHSVKYLFMWSRNSLSCGFSYCALLVNTVIVDFLHPQGVANAGVKAAFCGGVSCAAPFVVSGDNIGSALWSTIATTGRNWAEMMAYGYISLGKRGIPGV